MLDSKLSNLALLEFCIEIEMGLVECDMNHLASFYFPAYLILGFATHSEGFDYLGSRACQKGARLVTLEAKACLTFN